jgi:hypothetical protein
LRNFAKARQDDELLNEIVAVQAATQKGQTHSDFSGIVTQLKKAYESDMLDSRLD